MVVAHAIFVPGRGSGGLDSADEALLDQDTERVVDRLPGDRPDERPNVVDQLIGRGVGPGRNCLA